VPFTATARDTELPQRIIETMAGRLRGAAEDGVASFLGIPYGEPTGGPARFMPPHPAVAWSGIRDATRFGPKCPQLELPLPPRLVSVLAFADLPQSEDCLSLNIWTPEAATHGKPVLVWLHGGGFATGTGAEPDYHGANLARGHDVVVVTLNHRLNIFGYLGLGAIGGEAHAASGNVGMLDIVLALEWVRDNIAAFGGDPGNVTLFGQSGGGWKISALLAMPAAKGLFHKAAILSGAAVQAIPQAKATQTARQVLADLALGDDWLATLQGLPVKTLLAASAGREFGAVVDGVVLPSDPFGPVAPAISDGVPILVGTTADEGTIFLAMDPAFPDMSLPMMEALCARMVGAGRAEAFLDFYRARMPADAPGYVLASLLTDRFFWFGSGVLAERKAQRGTAPVYLYNLAWRTPVLDGCLRATHGVDMALWFDNADRAGLLAGQGAEAAAIAALLSGSLAAFARTGSPQTPVLPEWAAYSPDSRACMVFDITPCAVNDLAGDVRRFWEASDVELTAGIML